MEWESFGASGNAILARMLGEEIRLLPVIEIVEIVWRVGEMVSGNEGWSF